MVPRLPKSSLKAELRTASRPRNGWSGDSRFPLLAYPTSPEEQPEGWTTYGFPPVQRVESMSHRLLQVRSHDLAGGLGGGVVVGTEEVGVAVEPEGKAGQFLAG